MSFSVLFIWFTMQNGPSLPFLFPEQRKIKQWVSITTSHWFTYHRIFFFSHCFYFLFSWFSLLFLFGFEIFSFHLFLCKTISFILNFPLFITNCSFLSSFFCSFCASFSSIILATCSYMQTYEWEGKWVSFILTLLASFLFSLSASFPAACSINSNMAF